MATSERGTALRRLRERLLGRRCEQCTRLSRGRVYCDVCGQERIERTRDQVRFFNY